MNSTASALAPGPVGMTETDESTMHCCVSAAVEGVVVVTEAVIDVTAPDVKACSQSNQVRPIIDDTPVARR